MAQGKELQKKITVDGVDIFLTPPTELDVSWVGDDSLVQQLLACWLVLDESDYPLNPRLIGKPGVGKTTLAYAAAEHLGRPIYLVQATMDTRPEDLLITPVLESGNQIRYVASGIVSAMVTGGIAILDEGNRMSEKSWASLAPLLDHRRYIESILTGNRITADPDFRFCTTMNEDASTFDLPEYIHSRLQPKIYIDFPDAEEEYKILQENLSFSKPEILTYMVSFLRRGHENGESFSVRDAISVIRFAEKMARQQGKPPLDFVEQAVEQVLGLDKLELLKDD